MQDLIVEFRQTFLDAVQPRHLPAAWDVHHAARRTFGEHSVYHTVTPGQRSSGNNGDDAMREQQQAGEGLPNPSRQSDGFCG